jgi:hypothetical protein
MSVSRRFANPWRAHVGVLAWVVLLVFCSFLPAKSRASLIWDSNIGAALPIGSFSPASSDGWQNVNVPAPFAFPFLGSSYTSLFVSTSGFVWLGGQNGGQCCALSTPSFALDLFKDGSPRLSGGWAALRPDVGGTVNVAENSDSLGSRTVITYSNVATDATNLHHVTFQMQLFTTGEIVFSYQDFSSAGLGANAATLIGVTRGQALDTPVAVDFSGLPLTIGVSAYDLLSTNSPGFDLSGQSWVFTPLPRDAGFQVGATLTPEPSTFLLAASAILLLWGKYKSTTN